MTVFWQSDHTVQREPRRETVGREVLSEYEIGMDRVRISVSPIVQTERQQPGYTHDDAMHSLSISLAIKPWTLWI